MDQPLQKMPSQPLFDDKQGMAMAMQRDAAAVARATQEIQAALVIGQRNPRNEINCKARIIEACKRKGLAEVAEYEYSRGGSRIVGPTIDLLRAIANRWGNLLFGWDETDRREGESSVRCWAWDTQSNARAERTFVCRHWRDTQGGGYALNDERDIYELIANMAARRVRACLEEIIDSDIIADAVDQCRKTLKEGEKTPLKDRAVQMVTAFAEFGVTPAMIEARIGNKLEAVSENQLASLRRVFKGLKDGVGKREDYFKAETVAPNFPAAPEPEAPGASPVSAPVEPAASTVLAPPPATPPSPPETPPSVDAEETGKLKLLRGALRACRPVVKEGTFLGFLTEIGLSDGSVSTLEELMMVRPEVIERVIEDWANIKPRILASIKTDS